MSDLVNLASSQRPSQHPSAHSIEFDVEPRSLADQQRHIHLTCITPAPGQYNIHLTRVNTPLADASQQVQEIAFDVGPFDPPASPAAARVDEIEFDVDPADHVDEIEFDVDPADHVDEIEFDVDPADHVDEIDVDVDLAQVPVQPQPQAQPQPQQQPLQAQAQQPVAQAPQQPVVVAAPEAGAICQTGSGIRTHWRLKPADQVKFNEGFERFAVLVVKGKNDDESVRENLLLDLSSLTFSYGDRDDPEFMTLQYLKELTDPDDIEELEDAIHQMRCAVDGNGFGEIWPTRITDTGRGASVSEPSLSQRSDHAAHLPRASLLAFAEAGGIKDIMAKTGKTKEEVVKRLLLAESFYGKVIQKIDAKSKELADGLLANPNAADNPEKEQTLQKLKGCKKRLEDEQDRFAYYWAAVYEESGLSQAKLEKDVRQVLFDRAKVEDLNCDDWYALRGNEETVKYVRDVGATLFHTRKEYMQWCFENRHQPSEDNTTEFMLYTLRTGNVDYAPLGFAREDNDVDVITEIFDQANDEAWALADVYDAEVNDPTFNAMTPYGQINALTKRHSDFSVLVPPAKPKKASDYGWWSLGYYSEFYRNLIG